MHGMIGFNELEWEVINSEPYQRLRRIRQLSWTDYVYPGAMHTRFEHCMGVCHIVSRLFDSLISRRRNLDILNEAYGYQSSGLERQRQILRLAALTHDLGHGPFSHGAEEAMPFKHGTSERWKHEDYSEAIVREILSDLITNHPINRNFRIEPREITSLYSGAGNASRDVVWKELISGQMDADRMDYLLRDSLHTGVTYGKYDLDRLVNTIMLCDDIESESHVVGVEEDGMHAVEGLIIARYMMFTQMYYHKTRVAYDIHYDRALKHILNQHGGTFPVPDSLRGVNAYLKWDDWKVLSEINSATGSSDAEALRGRNHLRQVFSTPECPNEDDLRRFGTAESELHGLDPVPRDAGKSWYKFQKEEIRLLVRSSGTIKSVPLAERSPVVAGLRTVEQKRLYVPEANRNKANLRLAKI